MQTIKPYYFFVAAATFFSCQGKKEVSYETFYTVKGWGYDIRVDSRILIHQESIPGHADTNGFETKGQAAAMAKLVMRKMSGGDGMPSVTTEEVKSIERSNAGE